jgi:hypothetical protein
MHGLSPESRYFRFHGYGRTDAAARAEAEASGVDRLALIGAERGIHRLDAEVMPDNYPMLGVFEHAGFAVRRRTSFGELTVSLDITPTRRCGSGSMSAPGS